MIVKSSVSEMGKENRMYYCILCIFLHGKGKGLEWFVKFLCLKKVSETSMFIVCTILFLVA